MLKVFISHSNEDNAETLRIAEALRRAGYGVWVDFENIRGGVAWLCEIEAGIERCDAVLVALSATSRGSTWVERECLYAFQLKKPLIAALVADVLIPLHLVNIQHYDLRDPKLGLAELLDALSRLQARGQATNLFLPAAVSREPVEANFFPYIKQLPGGAIASTVARDLFYWARQAADEVAFGGMSNPGFHTRQGLSWPPCDDSLGLGLPAQSVSADSAGLPFEPCALFAPAWSGGKILHKLNRILPRESRIEADKVDKRLTFSLRNLSDARRLEDFKRLLMEIMDALRGEALPCG